MLLALDSSEFFSDLTLQSPRIAQLKTFVNIPEHTLIVPWVVLQEIETHVADQVREHHEKLSSIRRSVGRLQGLGATPEGDQYEVPELDEAQRRAKKVVKERLSQFAEIVPTPKDDHQLTHEAVVTRLQEGMKPFKGKPGARDLGYRDFLIWRTVVSAAQRAPSREITWISSNTEDFGENGELHPDLRDDARAEGITVVYFPSLDQFLKEIVEPELSDAEVILQQLDKANLRNDLRAGVRKVIAVGDALWPSFGARDPQLNLDPALGDLSFIHASIFQLEKVRTARHLDESLILSATGTINGVFGSSVFRKDLRALRASYPGLTETPTSSDSESIEITLDLAVDVDLQILLGGSTVDAPVEAVQIVAITKLRDNEERSSPHQ